jgi:hypothetical protein
VHVLDDSRLRAAFDDDPVAGLEHRMISHAVTVRPNSCIYRVATRGKMWAMTGSNRRPSPCKGAALPTELIARAVCATNVR